MNTHANLLRRLAPLQDEWTRAAMVDAANEIGRLEDALKDVYRAPDYARETVRQALGVQHVPDDESPKSING